MEPLTITVLCAMVLLGGALLWTLRADRRREDLQQRLKTVVEYSRSDADALAALPPLRRPTPSRAVGHLAGQALEWLRAGFAAAGNRIGMPHLIAVGCFAEIAVLALAFGVLGLNPGVAFLIGVTPAVAAALMLLRLAQARYRSRFLEVFPDALDLICRAVKAGLPVTESMAVAAREIADPVGSEFRRTLEEAQVGVEPQHALERTADRIRIPDFRFFVVTIGLQRRTGGSLAETLGNLSAVIRARKMVRLKARALSAETKASAAVLALLPFFVVGLLYLINPKLMSVLFSDPRGRLMLGVACLSLAMGIAAMVMIIRRSLR